MNLIALIKNLAPEELRVISGIFRHKDVQGKMEVLSQEARFFFLVRETPEEQLNDDYILSQLQLKKSSNAYARLKSRIFSKILDRMSAEDFLQNDELIESNERAEVRVQKKLMQVKILMGKTSKSDPANILHLVHEIIEEAKLYELYDSLVLAITYKKFILGFRQGYKEYSKIQKEIDHYRKLAKAKNDTNDFYYEFIINRDLISSLSKSELKKRLDEKVIELENSEYTTLSTRVQYFYKLFKLAQTQEQKRYSDSVDICLEILNLLDRSKAIAKQDRYGTIYLNLAHCQLYLRNFKQAAQTARAAQLYFGHKTTSYLKCKEQEFFATFYGEDHGRAIETLEILQKYNKQETGNIRADIYKFYEGCLAFDQGKFKESKRISNLALEILKDKPRWGLGVRYLKIMSLIELKEFEEARNAIESLRKLIERSKNTPQEIVGRDLHIYRAFHEFAMTDFSEEKNSLIYILKLLGNRESSHAWSMFTHEMIPVHKWMRRYLRENIQPKSSKRAKNPLKDPQTVRV
jgi:hypothetical protein